LQISPLGTERGILKAPVTESSQSAWLPIAVLLRPQGRRGEVLSEQLSTLETLFSPGNSIWLAPQGKTSPVEGSTPLTIDEHWFPTGRNAGRIVLKLAGCNTISDAEKLAGQQVFVRRADLPPLETDTFLIGDLLDCVLYDRERRVGKVVDVQFATTPDGRTRLEDAAPLLEVELNAASSEAAEEPVLIPFVKAWLDSVDIAAKRIVMTLPEGLVTTPESSPDGV